MLRGRTEPNHRLRASKDWVSEADAGESQSRGRLARPSRARRKKEGSSRRVVVICERARVRESRVSGDVRRQPLLLGAFFSRTSARAWPRTSRRPLHDNVQGERADVPILSSKPTVSVASSMALLDTSNGWRTLSPDRSDTTPLRTFCRCSSSAGRSSSSPFWEGEKEEKGSKDARCPPSSRPWRAGSSTR